jgi:hypothetical protein
MRAATARRTFSNASRDPTSPRRGASQPAAGDSKAHRWAVLPTFDQRMMPRSRGLLKRRAGRRCGHSTLAAARLVLLPKWEHDNVDGCESLPSQR